MPIRSTQNSLIIVGYTCRCEYVQYLNSYTHAYMYICDISHAFASFCCENYQILNVESTGTSCCCLYKKFSIHGSKKAEPAPIRIIFSNHYNKQWKMTKQIYYSVTLLKTKQIPEIGPPIKKRVFQPYISRGYVSFGECM